MLLQSVGLGICSAASQLSDAALCSKALCDIQIRIICLYSTAVVDIQPQGSYAKLQKVAMCTHKLHTAAQACKPHMIFKEGCDVTRRPIVTTPFQQSICILNSEAMAMQYPALLPLSGSDDSHAVAGMHDECNKL